LPDFGGDLLRCLIGYMKSRKDVGTWRKIDCATQLGQEDGGYVGERKPAHAMPDGIEYVTLEGREHEPDHAKLDVTKF